MSSSTYSLQVFLFLTLHLAPATSTFLQAVTLSSILLCSRCPNYLNLPCLTTSVTLCTPKRLYKSTLFGSILSIVRCSIELRLVVSVRGCVRHLMLLLWSETDGNVLLLLLLLLLLTINYYNNNNNNTLCHLSIEKCIQRL